MAGFQDVKPGGGAIECPTFLTQPPNGGAMSAVTQILGQIEAGDGEAAEELLRLVYDELRKLKKPIALSIIMRNLMRSI